MDQQVAEPPDRAAVTYAGTGIAEEISDEVLIARLQRKDVEALGLLYRRYARLVYSVCHRILRDSSEAEDVVHEVFLSLYRKCATFDPAKGAARSWIIQLAYSKCFDWRDYLKARHGKGQATELAEGVETGVTPPPPAPDPAYFILWNSSMVAAFENLSPEQKKAIEMFYFEGHTFQEIADSLGWTYGNVKHHVYRGVERLRQSVYHDGAQKALQKQGMRCDPGGMAG
jgi:RNA polymerase sigma-70 factor (ECF subfamily)